MSQKRHVTSTTRRVLLKLQSNWTNLKVVICCHECFYKMDDMLVLRFFIFSKNKNLFIARFNSKPNLSSRFLKVKQKVCELTVTSFCVIVAISLGDCYNMCTHSK
jgi:hypothetical protein